MLVDQNISAHTLRTVFHSRLKWPVSPGMASNNRKLMPGNLVWLLAHQLNGLMSSDSQGSSYHFPAHEVDVNFWRSHDDDV